MDNTNDYLQRQEAYRLTLVANQPTLRDQFAMSALTGVLENAYTLSDAQAAAMAYSLADAMLRERDNSRILATKEPR